jgi:actin-related protein
VGYSGEDSPKCVIQPYIGINKQNDNVSYYFTENQVRFFREGTKVQNVVSSNGASKLNHLKSIVENFDYFEKMTDELFTENLRIDPKEHPILFSEPSLHNKDNRLKLTEMMFEKYGIPSMFICKSAVLSAFSCGRSTCLVFDSGHSYTYAVPVHDGYALQKALLKFEIAGNWVTNELLKNVENNKKIEVIPHYKFVKNPIQENQFVSEYLNNIRDDPTYEMFWKKEIIRDMKENSLSVNEDPGNPIIPSQMDQSLGYELPDGRYVDLTNEKFSITEKLFYPMKEMHGFNGYHQMILDSILKSDLDIRKEMYANIFVCGGNTLFNNFPERLQKQLLNSTSQNLKIKIILHPSSSERRFSSWIGGSILSSLGTFHQMWLSKIEYEEHGAMIIERKCA